MAFTISNQTSGHFLGTYAGATEAEALDNMAVDAGYKSFSQMCETLEQDEAAERSDLMVTPFDKSKFVVCQSADGFSLHRPGATDEEIATGDEPPLVSGPGTPSHADYIEAQAAL